MILCQIGKVIQSTNASLEHQRVETHLIASKIFFIFIFFTDAFACQYYDEAIGLIQSFPKVLIGSRSGLYVYPLLAGWIQGANKKAIWIVAQSTLKNANKLNLCVNRDTALKMLSAL